MQNDNQTKLCLTWLCRILINECYRIVRANKKVVPLEEYMEAGYEDTSQRNYGIWFSL